MSTPAPAMTRDEYQALLAHVMRLDDDGRTEFFTANPNFRMHTFSGMAWHKSDMLRRAGDSDGAQAVLKADREAEWAREAARVEAITRPSAIGRVMEGGYAAFRVYFIGLVASGAAVLFGMYPVAAAVHGVAGIGAVFAGIIGAINARRGC